jgi:peptide/nickel transport system substrate-binding protein
MRHITLRWLAISSLLLSLAAHAAQRPRYGGVLRVEMRESWTDNANPLRPLVFENLTRIDDGGRAQPQLATSWDSQSDGRRWQFWLRRDVRFHDGAPLTASEVAASLAAACANCAWTTVHAVGDSVVFEFADARPLFAAELALPQYAIERPGPVASGTGPFRLTGHRDVASVELQAFEDYWGGRPFVDAIEIVDARPLRDEANDFDLGRADVVEIGPDHLRHFQQQHAHAWNSPPVELIAVGFGGANQALQDVRLRQMIAFAIDRAAIYNVVLQKQGEPAGGLLPNWISGYAFLLPHTRDLDRARQLRAQLSLAAPMHNLPTLKIAADKDDPVLEFIAERIALDLREAGLTVQTSPRNVADLFVTRGTLQSTAPGVAFQATAIGFTKTIVAPPEPIQRVYEAELDLVTQATVIPLAYLPRNYAIAQRVRNWSATPDGRPRLEQLWLEAAGTASQQAQQQRLQAPATGGKP